MVEPAAQRHGKLSWITIGGESAAREECSSLPDSSIDLESLCYAVEARYPKGLAGEDVFKQWGQRKFWTTEDYATPGFAFKYTSKKFHARAEATYEVLKRVNQKFRLDPRKAEIFDLCAGPGCAAAGAAKFLMERGVEEELKITLLDPVREWLPGHQAFNDLGLRTEFVHSPDLSDMLATVEKHAGGFDEDTTLVLCISHALKDFGGEDEALEDWWAQLAKIPKGRQMIVLVLEREPCANVLPNKNCRAFKAGGLAFEIAEPLPSGTDNSSHCAALFLPRAVKDQSAASTGNHTTSLPQTTRFHICTVTSGAASLKPQGLGHIVPRPFLSGATEIGAARGNSMSAAAASRPAMGQPRAPPPCPDCQEPMVTRTNRNGYNPGSKFWGCSQFPRCKGTRRQ